MHILLLPSWYATPDNPIRGSFFREQAHALRKAGHQVGMLIPPSKLRSFHGLKGAYRAQLEALIARLELGDQVSLLGLQTRKQVSQLLKESHVLASGSYFETFGVTLIEGMAAGRPILATRSHGPEYFIYEKIGLLVDPGDVDAMESAMRDMVEHYERYDSTFIRDECVRKYSEQAIVSQLETVYRKVIQTNEC